MLLKNDFYLNNNFLYLLKESQKKKLRISKKYIKINNRSLVIRKSMIGLRLGVYNGKYYVPLKVSSSHVGFMVGAFAFSHSIFLEKKKRVYKKKKKKRKY